MKAIIENTPGFVKGIFIIGNIKTIVQGDRDVTILGKKYLVGKNEAVAVEQSPGLWQYTFPDSSMPSTQVSLNCPFGKTITILGSPSFEKTYCEIIPNITQYGTDPSKIGIVDFTRFVVRSTFALGENSCDQDDLQSFYFLFFNKSVSNEASKKFAYPTLASSETIILK